MKKIVRHPEPLMKAREKLAYKFYESILKPDEYPESVLDDDPLSSVCYKLIDKKDDDTEYLIDRILKIYRVSVTDDWLDIDFWQALDSLEESQQEQTRQKTQKLLPKP